MVKSYRVGDIVESHEPLVIAKKMTEMLDEGKKAVWKENLKAAAEELCWENESLKLKEIYMGL